jgi:PKD repeat protein
MNSQTTHPPHTQSRLGRCISCATLATTAATFLLSLSAASATAALASSPATHPTGLPATLETASPYGETSRFGGYAAGAVSGKFDLPVGFAVDPENHPSKAEEEASPATKDHNAVYVLDRVVNQQATESAPGELGYRLQKLSSTGVVLGSVTLPVESIPYSPAQQQGEWGAAHPLISLAIDSSKHRVYALVEGMVNSGQSYFVPVAQRLIAWSTQPKATKPGEPGELVPAEEAEGKPYPEEDTLTHAALVAGQAALEPEQAEEDPNDLDAPEALAVEPATHEVVIEAQHGVTRSESSTEGGPTTLQRIITEGAKRGERGAQWTAGSEIAPGEERGTGLFTTSTGFGIDLRMSGEEKIANLALVEAGFAKASPLAPDQSGGVNLDEAPSISARETSADNGASNSSALGVFAAGSPVTQLTNGLYAASYGHLNEKKDNQANVLPWHQSGPVPRPFWSQDNESNNLVANMGLRLFEVSGQSSRIVTTIGGQAQGQACNLDFAQLSVAAGADESLFVLTQPNESNGNSDDQVIEFAPGGAGACPVPAGTVAVTAKSGSALATGKNGELLVYKGSPVRFDASGIERKGETPFEYDWNFTGVTEGGPGNEGYTLVSKIEAAGPYSWPDPTVEEYTYETLGLQEGNLRLIGDYGTSIFPFKVRVLEEKPPVAQFTAPASITVGQSVVFDASASTPTPGGSSIAQYLWQFGDGSVVPPSESPQESHTFNAPGTYTVTLTIEDELGKKAETQQEVTVLAASPPPCTANCGGTSSTTSGGTSTTSTPSPTTTNPGTTQPGTGDKGTKPTDPKPLTNTQKLAEALKACRKEKGHKRTVCEKEAKKKYTSTAKKKKKK